MVIATNYEACFGDVVTFKITCRFFTFICRWFDRPLGSTNNEALPGRVYDFPRHPRQRIDLHQAGDLSQQTMLSSSELFDLIFGIICHLHSMERNPIRPGNFVTLISYCVYCPHFGGSQPRYTPLLGEAKIRRFLLPCPVRPLTAGTGDK